MKRLHMLFRTSDHGAALVARVALGLLMLPHGLQKSLGWFGGYGFSATLQYFTDTIQLPAVLGVFIILAESLGALLLLAGVATRFWAFTYLMLMLGTIVTVHGSVGFFMNWDGNLSGEGYEYHLAMIALSLVCLVYGGGYGSLDRYWHRQRMAPRDVEYT